MRHRFKFLLASLWMLAVTPTEALAQTGLCPTENGQELPAADLNPVGIQQYLSKYATKLKSVEDVVCCLPQSYRDQFSIMHSSNSAQHSDLFGPRAILFDVEPGDDRLPVPQLKCAISFNGGEAHFGNPNNLELMCNNKSTKEIELYDIAQRNGKFELGERNPQACVLCHGSGGRTGTGGLRPIFEDVDQWTRAVQGIHACGAEETLSRALEKATQTVFKSNNRYKCLNQKIATARHFSGSLTSTAPDLTTLDLALMRLNARRTAKVLKDSKDYEQFQFALVGSLLCLDNKNDGLGEPWNSGGNLADWIPAKLLSQMNGTTWLPAEFAERSDLSALVREQLTQSASEFENISIGQIKAVKDLQAGKKPQFDFYRGPFNTCNNIKPQIEKIAPSSANGYGMVSTLDRYKAANTVHAFRGRRPNPQFRFLLESRGIYAGDFSMDVVGGSYRRSTDLLAAEIFVNAPLGSPLHKIGLDFFKPARDRAAKLGSAASSVSPTNTTDIEKIKAEQEKESADFEIIKRRSCSQLKKLSLEALKNLAEKGSADQTVTAPSAAKPIRR